MSEILLPFPDCLWQNPAEIDRAAARAIEAEIARWQEHKSNNNNDNGDKNGNEFESV